MPYHALLLWVIILYNMRISLIIPTLNAGMYIKMLISRLQGQDTLPDEIIIIDSSSEDNTAVIAREMGVKTIVIPRQSFNHGKTRNMAAAEAKGDTLLFMTQDAVPRDNTLVTKLTAPLQMPEIAAAFGRHIARPDSPPTEIFSRGFNYPDKSSVKGIDDVSMFGIKAFFFSNVCSAFKKDIFEASGMFPEVRSNEDMLMAARLILNNYKIAYVHDACVIHSHSYNIFQQLIRYYKIGSSLKHNNWLLKFAGAEGEGMRFIKEQTSFIIKRYGYSWLPRIFLESAAKYVGYRIGLLAG